VLSFAAGGLKVTLVWPRTPPEEAVTVTILACVIKLESVRIALACPFDPVFTCAGVILPGLDAPRFITMFAMGLLFWSLAVTVTIELVDRLV
jgi:hypothetical protein